MKWRDEFTRESGGRKAFAGRPLTRRASEALDQAYRKGADRGESAAREDLLSVLLHCDAVEELFIRLIPEGEARESFERGVVREATRRLGPSFDKQPVVPIPILDLETHSERAASQLGHPKVGTCHLLVGLLSVSSDENPACRLLRDAGIDLELAEAAAEAVYSEKKSLEGEN